MNKKDIYKFGSQADLAKILGISRSRVSQIFTSREKGGSNGALTFKQAKKILEIRPNENLEYLMEDANDI